MSVDRGAGAAPPAPGDAAPRCVLVGPPGSGTTTVGRLVADQLGLPWCDVEDLLAAEAGKSPGDVLVDDGEREYRRLEHAAARRALARPGVVVLGGGAALDEDIAACLRGLPVVFLDVTIADAARRIGFDANPGLVVLHPRRAWIVQMERLRPRYIQVATWTVDTGGRAAGDVAAGVADLLEAGRP